MKCDTSDCGWSVRWSEGRAGQGPSFRARALIVRQRQISDFRFQISDFRFQISDLQGSGSLQVSQQLDDVFGRWRRGGQVIAGRLESVLVGHPRDGDDGSFGRSVRVASLQYGAGLFGLLADLFLQPTPGHLDSVFRFESVGPRNNNNVRTTASLHLHFGDIEKGN